LSKSSGLSWLSQFKLYIYCILYIIYYIYIIDIMNLCFYIYTLTINNISYYVPLWGLSPHFLRQTHILISRLRQTKRTFLKDDCVATFSSS
jgi:hypothetical protein